MALKPIETVAEYQAAIKEIEELMSAEAGSPEGARLNALAILVEQFEAKVEDFHIPSRTPDA